MKITFDNSNPFLFQHLKKEVDEYFRSNAIKKTGNAQLFSKAIILIAISTALYTILLFATYANWLGAVLAFLLGIALISTAFNVMHDACHKSFSSKKWVNSLMGLTMNALGGNAFFWKIKHNVIHHTYTNIDGIDDDIANGAMLRLCASQNWRPIHRFQYVYMFFLYAVSTIAWMLVFDFVKYFSRRIHNTAITKMGLKEHIIFWLSKILYIVFYIVAPIICIGWLPWLVGFLIVHVTMGFTMSVIFQLAHVVEKTNFYTATNEQPVLDSSWAEHEIKTTSDFAPNNKWLSWLIGGLNFQIEHHLFPTISHVHYPAISKFVQANCQSFSLPYHSYASLGSAVASHIRLMKNLGKPPLNHAFKKASR